MIASKGTSFSLNLSIFSATSTIIPMGMNKSSITKNVAKYLLIM
jgi:hypothetical protein